MCLVEGLGHDDGKEHLLIMSSTRNTRSKSITSSARNTRSKSSDILITFNLFLDINLPKKCCCELLLELLHRKNFNVPS